MIPPNVSNIPSSESNEITVEFTGMMDFGESAFVQNLARRIIEGDFPKDSSDAVISEFALPCQPISPMLNPKLDITETNPKDFTQKSVTLELPGSNLKYKYRETKVINGQKVTFYFQELPKDKK